MTFTAFPLDEELYLDLSAGDAASGRDPLFETTQGELQALTRQYEDNAGAPRREGLLPVVRLLEPGR